MKSNFLHTFTNFLKLLDVKVTKTSAEQYLENHPEEGSMLGYTEALNYFNIENAAAKITQDELKSLPSPYVVFLNKNGGTFALVKVATENTIEWLDTQNGWVKDRWEEFVKDWSGIVLLAETDELSGESAFKAKRQIEILKNSRIPLAIGLSFMLIISFIAFSQIEGLTTNVMLILKLAGMVIAGLLFVKSTDSENELVNKFCNSGTKVSCQSILDSPAAKITPWLSWSDAGFIYFFGSFFGLLFSTSSIDSLNAYLSLQLVFSITALIFSCYSLYYQGVKAKMWCRLCLAVVTVFVLEAAVIFAYFFRATLSFKPDSIAHLLMGLSIPIIFLLLFKNTALRAQESKKLAKELSKLKTNPKIFRALLKGQKEIPEIPGSVPKVILGNEAAQHTITFVSNPLCTPCAKMHIKIQQLISANENINCEVIFLSNPNKIDPGGLFVRKVFSLPENLQAEAVHNWFERNDKNFEVWNAEYLEYFEQEGLYKAQERLNTWSNDAEVKGTPTLFINGRLVPDIVKIEELALQLSHINATSFNHGFADHLI